MADVTIYGRAEHLRAHLLHDLRGEGIGYERRDAAPHSPEILAYNPTGKIQGFQHRDLIWGNQRHLPLSRRDLRRHQAAAERSGRPGAHELLDQHGDRFHLPGRDPRHRPPRLGIIPADEAKIGQAAEKLERLLEIADQALQKSPYLAGDRLTLADLFLAPILFWLEKTPEGQAALPKYPAVTRWYQALNERPSFKATIPPMPGAA